MSNPNDRHVKCAIIGSGPAGYTAAIYAARAEMQPVLFSGSQIGGQLTTTTEVENYPGYPEGIQGPEMMEDFRKQAERFGTRLVYEEIVRVDLSGFPKKLWTGDGAEWQAETVIISTGASAKWLGLPSEQTFMNRGVSACAVCDGYFFRGKDIVVVGGGDSAAEEALYLSKLSPRVHLLVRRDEMRASRIMQQRVLNAPSITVHWNTETLEVLGDEKVTGVRVKNRLSGEEQVIPAAAFFLAIGHTPNTSIFEGQLDMDEKGYLVTRPGSTYTNIEGVFACGDVQDSTYRQAVTAAGSGCMAALDAERWLAAKEAELAGVA